MNKKIIAIIFISSIVPQISFASWWNPFSWNIWHKPFNNEQNKEDIQKLSITTSSSIVSNEPKTDITAKNPLEVKRPATSTDTVFCNNSYWNKCPNEQIFICPNTGDAYCQIKQIPKTASSPKTPSPAKEISPTISSISPSAVTSEQRIELINYLKGRSDIVHNLNSYLESMGNRNVNSFNGVLDQTMPKILFMISSISALKIPTVSFSDLLVEDQGLLRDLQSNSYSYALALRYNQSSDKISELLKEGGDTLSLMQRNIEKIRVEIRKILGDEFLSQVNIYL